MSVALFVFTAKEGEKLARIKLAKLKRHLDSVTGKVQNFYRQNRKFQDFLNTHKEYGERFQRMADNIHNFFKGCGSKRRKSFGSGYYFVEENQAWYLRNPLRNLTNSLLPDKFVTDFGDDDGKLSRSDAWLVLRNAKKALSFCSIDKLEPEFRERLEQRRDWNKFRYAAQTVLDLFPSLKHSYSSTLPATCNGGGGLKLVMSEKGKVRFAGVARSHSIWLDPIDSPKELFKYRLRIDRVIDWTYRQKFVPIMVTFTTFHRWHPLRELIDVLQDSWKDMFSYIPGKRRALDVDMKGWLRRLEITINDGDETSTNAGWHPHFHALILVPQDKLEHLSDMEQDWRDAWVHYVCKNFKKILGEEIDDSYIPAFREHGLVFSRYNHGKYKGQLRPVKSGKYLAKIMGCDNAEVFGGDTELTGDKLKNSKSPFDLMLDSSLPAGNIDLWLEYALATKGLPAFKFSKDLENNVKAYFDEHPQFDRTNHDCPTENVIAFVEQSVYQLLYRNFKLDDLKQKVTEGFDSLCDWFKETFTELGVPELCTSPFAMPVKPKPPPDDS